ncbi:MAG: MmgE/PrpD family protein [Burkholderiaceae bacterium]
MNADGLTRELARFVSGIAREGAPAEAHEAAKTGFIDSCATLIGGRNEPVVITALRGLSPLPAGQAPLLFGDRKADAAGAALVNGIAAHALDYDDVSLRGHPSAVMVPAILSLAAELHSSGARMLDAYVAGYETWGELVDREPGIHHIKGWHPTGIFGSIAAAAAAAVLMNLDEEQSLHALGLGASQSAGLMSNFGAMSKPFHAGRAAQAGIVAARLARAGFTASVDSLEHSQGFLAAVSPRGEVDRTRPAAVLSGLQLPTRRMNVKRYPLCYYTHRALDGMLAWRAARAIDPAEVERVEVRMSQEHATVLRNHRPATGLAAKFSIEFAMACALVAGRAGLTELDDAFVGLPQVQRLIERVHVTPIAADDPGTPGAAWADQVIVSLRGGRVLEGEPVHQALGHAERPLGRDELWAKFQDALAYGRYDGDARALFDRLSTLERQPRFDG